MRLGQENLKASTTLAYLNKIVEHAKVGFQQCLQNHFVPFFVGPYLYNHSVYQVSI